MTKFTGNNFRVKKKFLFKFEKRNLFNFMLTITQGVEMSQSAVWRGRLQFQVQAQSLTIIYPLLLLTVYLCNYQGSSPKRAPSLLKTAIQLWSYAVFHMQNKENGGLKSPVNCLRSTFTLFPYSYSLSLATALKKEKPSQNILLERGIPCVGKGLHEATTSHLNALDYDPYLYNILYLLYWISHFYINRSLYIHSYT